MEKFELGDVVVLKSGGPKMTIISIEKNNTIYAVWFSGDALYEKAFQDYLLTKHSY